MNETDDKALQDNRIVPSCFEVDISEKLTVFFLSPWLTLMTVDPDGAHMFIFRYFNFEFNLGLKSFPSHSSSSSLEAYTYTHIKNRV